MTEETHIWTEEQVKSLNDYQKAGKFHPFTCGNPKCPGDEHGFSCTLVATRDGWICPKCDYTQGWAHGWMVDGSWDKC